MAYDKEQFDAMVAGLNTQDIPGIHKVAKPRLRAGQVVGRIIGITIASLVGVAAVSLLVWGITTIWGAILS
ncbi:hypothetical protein M2390_003242 [Mycetocola sp. BIGb0189]|uniref:hypothetical protein n=1 Tax=Mycetocola sp. BIGb0189 TaxID=2940604 RepID=UPI0021670D8B|nr:hypothetical protein [Mycetocola sp. BIGb0189]MCS4278022.1 hypothetical protein [Mycetocola sp. BIGb0189]